MLQYWATFLFKWVKKILAMKQPFSTGYGFPLYGWSLYRPRGHSFDPRNTEFRLLRCYLKQNEIPQPLRSKSDTILATPIQLPGCKVVHTGHFFGEHLHFTWVDFMSILDPWSIGQKLIRLSTCGSAFKHQQHTAATNALETVCSQDKIHVLGSLSMLNVVSRCVALLAPMLVLLHGDLHDFQFLRFASGSEVCRYGGPCADPLVQATARGVAIRKVSPGSFHAGLGRVKSPNFANVPYIIYYTYQIYIYSRMRNVVLRAFWNWWRRNQFEISSWMCASNIPKFSFSEPHDNVGHPNSLFLPFGSFVSLLLLEPQALCQLPVVDNLLQMPDLQVLQAQYRWWVCLGPGLFRIDDGTWRLICRAQIRIWAFYLGMHTSVHNFYTHGRLWCWTARVGQFHKPAGHAADVSNGHQAMQ